MGIPHNERLDITPYRSACEPARKLVVFLIYIGVRDNDGMRGERFESTRRYRYQGVARLLDNRLVVEGQVYVNLLFFLDSRLDLGRLG